GASQLTSVGGAPFSYDSAGNRTNAGYQTGAGNRGTSDGTWTYSYDDEGRRGKKSQGASGETWNFGHEPRGQMLWAEQRATDGGTLLLLLDYQYDAWGNRIQTDRWTSATGTVASRYGFDGEDLWADLDSANALTARYVQGPDGEQAPAARVS